MLRVAIVGIGGISTAHINGWNKIKDAEIIAICDVRPEQMERYPQYRRYTDFEVLLQQESLDIVDICLPTYLHVEYAIRAMQCGIHVLCEKPISLFRDDVARVYGVAAQNNVKFMVAQVLRFWPEFETVKELYLSEKYGKLLSGSMRRIGNRPQKSFCDWMIKEEYSGLVPFDLHIHDVDFMVYAFGNPKHSTVFRKKCDNQDYLTAVYSYDDFFITAEAAWYAPHVYPFSSGFRFQFEGAVAEYSGGQFKIYQTDGQILDYSVIGGNQNGNIGLPQTDAYTNEISYFANAVQMDTHIEKVQPSQLETVIDILHAI